MKRPVPVLITWDVDPDLWLPAERRRWAFNTAMDSCHALDIRATFYITAQTARLYRDDYDKLRTQGHEVGCHGWTHGTEENYDMMSRAHQQLYITMATEYLQTMTGQPIQAFRSPRVKTSGVTQQLLTEQGYLSDSSVCSQRMDVISSNLINPNWLLAPRRPYHPQAGNAFKPGQLPIWQIPISALGLPFISSTMQVTGLKPMKRFFQLLYAEARYSGKPIVYLAHPTEFIQGTKNRTVPLRAYLKVEHFKPSYIRAHGLLLRGLLYRLEPTQFLNITQELLAYMASFPDVSFMTMTDYTEQLHHSPNWSVKRSLNGASVVEPAETLAPPSTNSGKERPKPLTQLGIKSLFLVWAFPHGSHRSELMAHTLGMELEHVYFIRRKGLISAALKYPVQTLKTPLVLWKHRPRLVMVQNPPIFGALIVYLWGLISGTKFIIDSHTDALLASWWQWTLPLHRFLSRRAITTLVTNEHLYNIVAEWPARAFILVDPPVTYPHRTDFPVDETVFNVAVVSTASYDEPIDQVLIAARRLPTIQFYITGNFDRDTPHHRGIKEQAPANVQFTGYIPDEQFYGLLAAAQVVMSLTTEDHTIQSGASEALWLGKPVITSDWPVLRTYFSQGAILVDNTAEAIEQAITTMQAHLPAFETGIRQLQQTRQAEWWQRVSRLIQQIQQAV